MAGDYTRFTFKAGKRYSGVLMQQGRVQLDADWNEAVEIAARRWQLQAIDTFGGSVVPLTTPNGFKLADVAGPPADLAIGVGRIYVDGLLAEALAGETLTYLHQPFLPLPPAFTTIGGPNAIAYLDVWEREITYLEDPEILEKALGGPDTATRTQTVWQVKLQGTGNVQPTCQADLDALFPPSGGRLSTRAITPPADDNPCIISPSGGYRGLENRLYRLEVHTPGTLAQARFKWSRDNASTVSVVEQIATSGTQSTLTIARIGRDQTLRFAVNDWVEVIDDVRELMGEPGLMARIVAPPDEATRAITLDRAVPVAGAGAFGDTPDTLRARHTRVRRWDQQAGVDGDGLLTLPTAFAPLEAGIEIQFAQAGTGHFKVGDYWVFAARTADGTIEELNAAPPRGIVHHYVQLATLNGLAGANPTPHVVSDCRALWPPKAAEGCCTVTVGDGIHSQGQFQNLAAAMAAVNPLPAFPVRVCLLPGVHHVGQAIALSRDDLMLGGCGAASRVVSESTAFAISGDRVALEGFVLEAHTPAPAVTWTGSHGRMRGLTLRSPDGPGLIADDVDGLMVSECTIEARLALSLHGADLRVLRDEINGGLEIRGGSGLVRVAENQIVGGAGNGVTLGTTLLDEKSPVIRDVTIADNLIAEVEGSGIASAVLKGQSDTGLLRQIQVLGLRILDNVIRDCADKGAERDDGLPHGGIVLAAARDLVIRRNQIQRNGTKAATRICGVFVDRAIGLDVSDNRVVSNGAPPKEAPERAGQGGVVVRRAMALPTAAVQIIASEKQSDPAARAIGARVSGNTIIAPGLIALHLRGIGPMQVNDNRLVSLRNVGLPADSMQGLVKLGQQFAEQPDVLVGAVLILNEGPSPYLPSVSGGHGYTGHTITTTQAPLAPGRVGGVASPGGAVQFSDNQVTFETLPDDEGAHFLATLIFTLDDLAMSANQSEVRQGGGIVIMNALDLAMTARATDNGYFENGLCLLSLGSRGMLMSIGADNQGTHCIAIEGPPARTVDRDNQAPLCGLQNLRVIGLGAKQ